MDSQSPTAVKSVGAPPPVGCPALSELLGGSPKPPPPAKTAAQSGVKLLLGSGKAGGAGQAGTGTASGAPKVPAKATAGRKRSSAVERMIDADERLAKMAKALADNKAAQIAAREAAKPAASSEASPVEPPPPATEGMLALKDLDPPGPEPGTDWGHSTEDGSGTSPTGADGDAAAADAATARIVTHHLLHPTHTHTQTVERNMSFLVYQTYVNLARAPHD